jgi:hypothetical protein
VKDVQCKGISQTYENASWTYVCRLSTFVSWGELEYGSGLACLDQLFRLAVATVTWVCAVRAACRRSSYMRTYAAAERSTSR